MKKLIEQDGATCKTGWPLKLQRYAPGREPDPGACVDAGIIVNDPRSMGRGHVAVSDGRSWVPLAWLDEVGTTTQVVGTIGTAPLAPAPALQPVPRGEIVSVVKDVLRTMPAAPVPAPAPATATSGLPGLTSDPFLAVNYWLEAVDCLKLRTPTKGEFPFIAALIGTLCPDTGRESVDMRGAAETVIAERNEWAARVAAQERARLAK